MKHILLRSSAFLRDSRRFLRKHPELTQDFIQALRQLEADPYHPSLKTHKLKGKLKKSWACSAGYDLRLVFSFTRHAGKPAILLETVGTHDEAY